MDNLQFAPVTACFGPAGLAVGTTTTTSTANAINFSIAGKAYTKAIAANGTTPTLDSNTGVAFLPIGINKAGVHVICVDSGGVLRAVQGEIVDYTDAGVYASVPKLPPVPDTLCPIGLEFTKVISTGQAWTMGVTNQATLTGITHTFVDLTTMPGRPFTA